MIHCRWDEEPDSMWSCRVADRERQTPTHLTHGIVMPEPGLAALVGTVATGALITASAAVLTHLWH
ncbi:hypothetical protein ACWCPT_15310 [Streptomyces sp. NPDC002308]